MSDVKVANNYDGILLNLIEKLDEFPYLEGTEGRAYFIDENFVVKTFFYPIYHPDIFEKYCEEIQNFAKEGLSVPQIYSWCTILDKKERVVKGYILEQRINGKNVFFGNIEDIYFRCKELCTLEEFKQVLTQSQETNELLNMIIK